MAGCQPGIHLHRQKNAIGNIVSLYGIGQGVHVHRTGGRSTRFLPEGGIAVPAQRHEHVVAKPTGDRHCRVLQRCRRAGAAHVHGGRIAQHVDAKIGGHFLRCRVDRRRHHAVDIGRLQPGIRDCTTRRLEHHVHCGAFGALDEIGFAHASYGGLVGKGKDV